ncbi:DUF4133 domain-containing protein [Hymenobacter sp. GOD-10R]|uniref:DUF4133 domain-containing protein n=1 Tax=Hymenobacter sp. GOD-10R TaxID=3093922 RepID=UPI002D7715A0|nr:DUF4133 domain-containing protein [Hymenobacter sp. GOD-10R]WRQ31959.1 DUF4133 domain-containing protein [Hymenobacter sp. GOD-10R]
MGQYLVNKGVNKPIEFIGLVGVRYLFMLIGGLGGVFLAAIVLLGVGVNTYLTTFLTLGSGFLWWIRVFSLCAKYGEHGALKRQAKGRQPVRIVNRNARLFQDLKRS